MFKSMPMPGVKLPEPDSDEEEDTRPLPAVSHYGASDKQYRFFKRMADAFVRVGLLDKSDRGNAYAYLPGAGLSVKDAVKKSVPRFLNRLLGLSLADQKLAFGYFQSVFDATIVAAKSRGEYDSGIRSLGAPLTQTDRRTLHTDRASGAATIALSLTGDLGFSFQAASDALAEAEELATQHGETPSPHNGFYIDKTITDWGGSGHPRILLVTQIAREAAGQAQYFLIRRPNNGFDRHRKTIRELLDTYKPLKSLPRAQQLWDYWFNHTDTACMHGPKCSRRAAGQECTWGGRHSDVQMISGAVLPIWKLLHEVVSKSVHGRNAEGQKKRTVNVQRGHLVNGDPVIGMTMLKEDYELVLGKIEEIESEGGIEALARSAWGNTGIWGDLEDVWAPEDDFDPDALPASRGEQLLRNMANRAAGSSDGEEEDEDEEEDEESPGSRGSEEEEEDDEASSSSSSSEEEEEEEEEEETGAGRKKVAAAASRGAAASRPRRPAAAAAAAATRSTGGKGRRGGAAAGRSRSATAGASARRRKAASSSEDDDDADESSSSDEEEQDAAAADSSSDDDDLVIAPPSRPAASRGQAGRPPKSTTTTNNNRSTSKPPIKRQKKTPEEALESARLGSQAARAARASSRGATTTPSGSVGAAAAAAGGGSADTSGRARRGAAAAAAAGGGGGSRLGTGSKQQQKQKSGSNSGRKGGGGSVVSGGEDNKPAAATRRRSTTPTAPAAAAAARAGKLSPDADDDDEVIEISD